MTEDYLHEYARIVENARDYLKDGWMKGEKILVPDPADFLEKSGGGETPDDARRGGEDASKPASESSRVDVGKELESIAREVSSCVRCRLAETRTYAVPGEGPAHPEVMVIGEAPGGQEDSSGRPFVGRAGKYLDKWLAAIELDRERDVFIGNIIKCRPPNNRDPYPDEQTACIQYLERQVDLIRPYAILTVGRISTHILTGAEGGIGKLHGREFSYRGIPLIPTYHPSGVLRNPQYRKPVWEDLKKLRALIQRGE